METMGSIKKIFIVAVAVVGSISLVRTIFLLWNSTLPDFGVLYTSANNLLHRKNPYTDISLFTQVNYSPIGLTPFIPFMLFPLTVASNIWLLLSLVFFFIASFLLYKTKKLSKLKITLLISLTVISFPFKFTLGMGQVNLLVLLLICMYLYLLSKKKYTISALFLYLAAVVKLFPVVLLYYPLITKQKMFLLSFMCFTLVGIMLSLVFFGISINQYYFTKILLPLFTTTAGDVYYNQSLTGTFARFAISPIILLISRVVIVFLTGYTVLKVRKSFFLAVSFLLTTILLVNNFTWQHHMVLLFIVFYFLLTLKLSVKQYILIIFAAVLIMYNSKDPSVWMHTVVGNAYLSHGSLGMFLLWILQYQLSNTKKHAN